MNNILDYLEEEKVTSIEETISALHNCSKGKLMKLAFNGDTSGVDSAVPHHWVLKMKLTNTDFDTFWWVISYKKEHGGYGKPIHLGELILTNLMQKLK